MTTEEDRPKVSTWCYPERSPEERFNSYDHWEVYDSTKVYQKGPYQAIYNSDSGLQTYKWWPQNATSGSDIPKWMVARLYMTDEEVKALAPFCRCEVCKRKEVAETYFMYRVIMFTNMKVIAGLFILLVFMIGFYITIIGTVWVIAKYIVTMSLGCAGCYGCIKNGHDDDPREYILKEALAYRDKK